MEENLTSCWPFLGVPLKHVSQELNCFAASIWNQGLQVIGYALGPAEVHSTWKLVAFRPVSLKERKERNFAQPTHCMRVYTLECIPVTERQSCHYHTHIQYRGTMCHKTQEHANGEIQRKRTWSLRKSGKDTRFDINLFHNLQTR